jgi:hypothetical protein
MPSLRNASGEGDDPAAVRLWQPAVCLKRVSNTVEKSARGEKKKTRSDYPRLQRTRREMGETLAVLSSSLLI